jgi:hypothetical protein
MTRLFVPLAGIGLAAALCVAQPLWAQVPAPPQAPAASRLPSPPQPAAVDPATIEVPDLTFRADADAEKSYDKYFFFHRDDTDFATAYADILECDGYARGLSYRAGSGPVYNPYAGTLGGALGGAIGGAIGSALADAIYGSAERRRLRRSIMRTCMGFKDNRAYGLPRDVWERFNFEEGLSHVEPGRRQHLLQVQAKVASGPRPRIGEIVE